MTNEQKYKIAEFRQSGYGYANIADALGLTKNQVSAYCRRAGLTGTKAAVGTTDVPVSNCCRNCGKPLMQVAGRKPVKFCSDACRIHWWNTHPDAVEKRRSTILHVPAAGSPSGPMAILGGNTAATPAMFRLGSKVVIAVTEEQFDREKRYQASMNMFRTMLKNGLITEEQYAIIDTKMLEKDRPLLGTLFSESTCYSGLSERCIVPERS